MNRTINTFFNQKLFDEVDLETNKLFNCTQFIKQKNHGWQGGSVVDLHTAVEQMHTG